MELEGNQTEWNGGTLTNVRLHTIREEIRQATMLNDIATWQRLLVQMNHELYGFQSEEQKKTLRQKLTQLAEKINQQKSKPTNYKGRQIGIPADIIDDLNDMEYELDEIFHKSGLQTKLGKDSRASFG